MGKYLDKPGVQQLWDATKQQITKGVNESVGDKIGQPNGVASLDDKGKLKSDQLPALKTINGESVVGEGNIAIDLNIYQIVESLPESNQNPNKIYLVLSETNGTQNLYTEYAWINNAWEKLGEYKAEVDLSNYLKKEDIEEEIKDAGFVTFDDVATESKNGVITKEEKKLLNAQLATSNGGAVLDLLGFRDDTSTIILQFHSYKNGSISYADAINFPMSSNTSGGAITSVQYKKLSNIEEEATKDEAITSEELDAILV